jgi:Uri superfamily endonuclease
MNGVYVLIIESHADMELEIGKLGRIPFKKGFYAYVGSALRGLEQRIGRHRRHVGDNKKLHWHIDYLLASPAVELIEVICAETEERKECEIAVTLNQWFESIQKFGCSDCSCTSHLFCASSVAELNERVYDCLQSAAAVNFRATRINPV